MYFLSLILFFFSNLVAQQSYTICYSDGLQLPHWLPEQLPLAQLTYTSDIPLSASEFYYLIGIGNNTLINRSQLQAGLYALHKKGIFESIWLEITNQDNTYHIAVRLQGTWTIKKIKTSSAAIIKRFSQYYGLNVGDCFDEKKHTTALEKIVEQAYQHGYCNARVHSDPVFYHATKSVTIPLDIQLGPLFYVDECSVTCYENIPTHVIATIEHKMRKKWRAAVYRTKLEQLSKDYIAQLLMHEGFFNPEIEIVPIIDHEHAQVKLEYTVNPGARFLLQFEGNQTFSCAQLIEHIAQHNGAGLLPLSLVAQELKRLYEAHGFFNSTVQIRQEDDHGIFVINEGIQSKITHVSVQGCITLDELWVARRFFSACSAGRYYDQKRIAKAIERLRLYYELQGFIHANITYEIEPSEVSNKQLKIIVQEGPQYHIESESYQPTDVLQAQSVPSLTGLPFYAERITRQKQLITDYLRTQGYLYAHVEPVFSYENTKIALCWHITTGQKINFGKTIVQGPSWLDISYILPRLPYKEGEPFCMKSLEEAAEAIRALHICDTIQIYPDQNQSEIKPILLKITPDDPFEIRARFGIAQVSNNFTFRPGTTYAVGGSFMYKNPFGHADQLSFNMDFTRFEHTTVAEYLFPLKTKLPLNGLIKAYDSVYQQPLFPGSDQSLYTIIQRGFLAGLTLNYKSLTAGLNYGIEWATITDVCSVCACALDFQPSLINTNIPSFIIEPTVLAHYENDHFNPWISSTTLLSIKGVMPLYTRQAATGFVRFLVEQSGSVRVSPTITFAGRVRMGHVFNQFFRAILPPERFYLGGAFSVRGYESDLVPPLSLVNHDNCCVLVPRGGRSMINMNAELRFEVGRYMILAIFQDVGALSDGLTDMHWVAATGGGIRFKTPIGIVRFDVGFKWKTLTHESCCAWFLTLGNPF